MRRQLLAWGERPWKEKLAGDWIHGVLRRGGIGITAPSLGIRYTDLAGMPENADRNFTWRNAVVGCGAFAVRDCGVNEWFTPSFTTRAGRPALRGARRD